MIDARIAVTLPGHPKTKKLIRRLGDGAAWKLICLFLWAASNRPNGDLSGLADDDIEIAVDWSGEEGAFIGALRAVGFVDGEPGAYQIHDWSEHNAWASGADLRSAKARWNAVKRHHGEAEADRQVPEWAEKRAAYSASSIASSIASSNAKDFSSNAPSPSPSPSPSLKPWPQSAAFTEPEVDATPSSPPLAFPTGPDPITARACELAGLLLQRGAKLTATNPEVRRWAADGVTDGEALQALEIAQQRRETKADPSPIPANYLSPILRDIRSTPPGGGARASPAELRRQKQDQWLDDLLPNHRPKKTMKDVSDERTLDATPRSLG